MEGWYFYQDFSKRYESALVQVRDWRRTDNMQLPKTMATSFIDSHFSQKP